MGETHLRADFEFVRHRELGEVLREADLPRVTAAELIAKEDVGRPLEARDEFLPEEKPHFVTGGASIVA